MINFLILSLVIFFSIFTILISISFAKKVKLIDLPNNRKTHKINAKLIGGIVLILNFFLLVFLLDLNSKLSNLLNFSILVGLIGLIDDKHTLKVSNKLILLFFPIILIILDGYTLTNLGEYNLIGKINLGSFAIIFTILASYLLINATNYIDGKDGVLISIFFFINLKLIFLIYNTEEISKELLIYIDLILIILFFFNITNNKNFKIFLGDSGSLTIGFFLSFILIYLANNKLAHPILLASTVTVIVFDFICISIERLFKNSGRIFKPDNNHIHHLIYNKTGSNLKMLLIINSINILFFSINYYLFTVYSLLAMISFIVEFFLFLNLRKILLK